MATVLKTLTIPSFSTGLDNSIPAHLIDLTSVKEAKNMRFSYMRAEKAKGYSKFNSNALSGIPQIIKEYTTNAGTRFLVVVTTTEVYKYNTGTSSFDNITGGGVDLTGTAANPASSCVAFGNFYFTNGNDFPQFWDGAASAIAVVPKLDGSSSGDIEGGFDSSKARLIAEYAGFLVLGYVTDNSTTVPYRVRWSRFGDPTLWKNTAAGAGQAGYADMPGQEPIIAMVPMKDFLVIYRSNSIWLMQYVGLPEIFIFRKVIDGVDASGRNCIQPYKNYHIVFALDNFYLFDGVQVSPVGNRVSRTFFSSLNADTYELNFTGIDELNKEVLCPYVVNGQSYPQNALVYNYETGAFGTRQMVNATAYGTYRQVADLDINTGIGGGDAVIDSIDIAFDDAIISTDGIIPLFGDSSGYIYKMNLVDTLDDSDLDGYFITKVIDFNLPQLIKRLQRIQVLSSKEGDYNLDVSVAVMENSEDTVSFGTAKTLNLSNGVSSFIDVDYSGRYFCIRIRTDLKNEPFRITGLVLYYNIRGMQ